MTAYRIFSLHDAAAFARHHYSGFAGTGALVAEETGDDKLTRLFRVSDQGGQGVIVKQALPATGDLAERWPQPRYRAAQEARVLLRHGEFSPKGTQALLYHDDALSALLLEDLSGWRLWRRVLLAEPEPVSTAPVLGRHLARVLYGTSDFHLPAEQKRAGLAQLANAELCAITDRVFFHDPYQPHGRNRIPPGLEQDVASLWQDRALKHRVGQLRLRLQCDAQALLHGNLHTGSVLVKGGECRVFDAEFGFYGPMGFDLGVLMANLMLNFCGLPGWNDAGTAEAARFARAEEIRLLWKAFSQEFKALAATSPSLLLREPGLVADYLLQVWRDSLGFAGTEMIRRTVGVASVADLDGIAGEAPRQACQRQALWLGRRLILDAGALSPLGLCSWFRRMAAGTALLDQGHHQQCQGIGDDAKF